MSKPNLLPKATPIRSKRSNLTESSKSRTPSFLVELPKSSIYVSTETLVTPTIFGTSVSKEEVSQLPKDISTNPIEIVTEVVQQQVDPQLDVSQQEITSELEQFSKNLIQNLSQFKQKVTSELELVQEPLSKSVVLLPKHLDLEFEHSKVVTLLEDDQLVTPQTSVITKTSTLSKP